MCSMQGRCNFLFLANSLVSMAFLPQGRLGVRRLS